MSKRGEIDLTGIPGLERAQEFLRMWTAPGSPVTCLIDPRPIGADPMGFGIAMVDAIRHGALAYAQAVGVTPEHALERIWEGFDAERNRPTSEPKPLAPKGKLN